MPESDQAPNRGLICAYRLDGAGGGTPLTWPDIETSPLSDGVTWLHLDLVEPSTTRFVRERSGQLLTLSRCALLDKSPILHHAKLWISQRTSTVANCAG